MPPATSSEPTFIAPPLPPLTDTPKSYPGCCLALSVPLVDHLHTLLPPAPSLTLSIGSGYGLLEALLNAHNPAEPRNIVGVEVHPSSNMYLPPSQHETVYGSRMLHDSASAAKAWIFVYPRRVGLLDEYLRTFGSGSVDMIIWLGPKADWEDHRPSYMSDLGGATWNVQVESTSDIGGRAWEAFAVARKFEATMAEARTPHASLP